MPHKGEVHRKVGEAKKDVIAAIEALTETSQLFSGPEAKELARVHSQSQYHGIMKGLKESGYIESAGLGLYKRLMGSNADGDGQRSSSEIRPAVPPNPIEELGKQFLQLPDLLTSIVDTVVELAIEPEVEIMNIIERRNKRIGDLEVLLSKTKLDLSNSRAKIEELLSRINRISSQKNRVIPETKVVYRDSRG